MNKVKFDSKDSLEEILAEWLFQYDTSHRGSNKEAAKMLVDFLKDRGCLYTGPEAILYKRDKILEEADLLQKALSAGVDSGSGSKLEIIDMNLPDLHMLDIDKGLKLYKESKGIK